MKNKGLHRITAVTVTAALLASPLSFAQVTEDGMGKILPVELYACSFVDGKGQSDLDAVIAQWTAFMDERNVEDYAAWQLTPFYYGPAQGYDLLWMGVSTDGEAMGRNQNQWITEGGEVAAAFEEVIDCGAHIGLSSAMYKAATPNEAEGPLILSISDCKMNEGTRYSDVRSAEIEWADYGRENDLHVGTYHWYPGFGDGNQDYDYKLLSVFNNFEALGADWEMFANGGGRGDSRDIFGELDDCDDARIYVAAVLREAPLRE